MADVDVVVVGAGIAGLRAADLIARDGATVRVLEARDRIGGRLLTEQIGKARFDVGGQWIGPHQKRAWALTRELGLETFDTYDEGDSILWIDGEARRYQGTIPRLDPLSLIEMQVTLMRIEALRKKVDARHPGRTPDAAELDRTTLGAWMRNNVRSRAVRVLIEAAMRVVFGVDARELSFLTFLFYAQTGEGVMKLIEIRDGAQQTRFVEGAQRLAYGLAERLDDAVLPGRPVRSISVEAGLVRIRDDVGETRARRVVVAVPPSLARRILFTPELPPERRRILDRSPSGATTKHILLYERSFWRDEGLSGEVVCDEGPFSVVMDNTSADGSQPALVAFSVGQPARELAGLPEAERKRRVVSRLAETVGRRAQGAVKHVEKDWCRERWSRGCPVGLPMTGILSRNADEGLRASCGPVHWAGTETAREHYGFIEGALESAERVAREVKAAR